MLDEFSPAIDAIASLTAHARTGGSHFCRSNMDIWNKNHVIIVLCTCETEVVRFRNLNIFFHASELSKSQIILLQKNKNFEEFN